MLTTAISSPFLHGLLALTLFLLVVVLGLAIRLVTRARIDRQDSSASADVSQDGSSQAVAPLARPPIDLALPIESRAEAAPSQSPILQFRQANALADLFADPMDGTPFFEGEEILVCRCGVGYHLETWAWVQEQHAGKCVHCGGKGVVEMRMVQPRA